MHLYYLGGVLGRWLEMVDAYVREFGNLEIRVSRGSSAGADRQPQSGQADLDGGAYPSHLASRLA